MPALVGIDIGGSKLALAVADERGVPLRRARWPTDPAEPPARALERLAGGARRLLAEAGLAIEEVAAVGVAAPGPLDAGCEHLLSPPNLPGWDRVPLRRLLTEALGRPVRVENDANAAALAEWRFGAGRGASDLVYLTLSTGVGAGLILAGRLYRGRGGNAGELGHAPLVWEGERCACGLRGCAEAYLGGAAWTRRLRQQAPAASLACELAGGRDRLQPEHVVEAARAGDAFARSEIDRYNDHLARLLCLVVFALAPERIVLGTIPSRAGEELCLAAVRERVAARVWPLLAEGLRILPSGLGEELPDYAGLGIALEELAARGRGA
jgi:glucokinase